MISRRRAVLALLAALLALALPAVASAEVIINSAADEPDAVAGGVCESAAGGCTLRAAIEVTNAAGTAQEVFFNSTPFDGQGGATVVLTSPLPAIEAPISLIAARWGSPSKPAAGVSGPTGNFGIIVKADGVTIRNVSITGALTGINVIDGSENFTATGDWIGVKLDGTAGPNNTGIFIDPESDGATIGTAVGPPEFAQPNVIAGNNNEGLDIEGASNAVIRNNYFGVAPDGITQMANAKDIEITDSTSVPGFPAENNEIGASVESAALTSAACDGGCNVISGAAGAGIDLNGSGLGEEPASGPTTIRGNFVGLDKTGTNVIGNGSYGVLAGGADHVTVGGFPLGDANYIAGGGEGIASESKGQDFKARGNRIGFASDGGNVSPPSTTGIFVLGLEVTEEPSIETNHIRMAGGIGVETRFVTGRITGNEIEGGSTGILTKVGEGAGLIASNEVEAPTEHGIVVESPDNEVRANTVIGSGLSGIRVRNPPGIAMTGNLVGGSTTEKENVIEGSGGPAIEVLEQALEPGSTTEITRNRGGGNSGLFIDLVAGANEGILPPAFSAAIQSKAEGTAAPGATVRVFRKASAEPGELQSFLAEAVADGSGKWSVTYPQVPTGTIVAATQTNVEGATSELKTATTSADPSTGGGGSGGGGAGGDNKHKEKPKGKEKGKDRTAPQTTIVKKKIKGHTAKFKFVSSEVNSSFQCRLDKKKFKPCRSPKKYKRLKPGKHVFEVRAIDAAGNKDKTPATRKFRVLPRR
jgi:Right handed beta helix region